jgi:dTDP-4-amino-4,6-dideoxygalactose transaminase
VIKNNDEFLDIFEKRLSEFTGAPYVILTDRCTNAIFLSLWYLKNYKNIDVSEITLPSRTYQSVPMTLKNLLGSKIIFEDYEWDKMYMVHNNIIDASVGFEENMYIPGTMMCLSFQQKKALPIGKGGAILLDNKEDYSILSKLVHDGRKRYLSDREEIKNNPEDILCGFHMNMSPDEAAKGVLLLNQYKPKPFGSSKDYEDLRKIECLK